MDIPLGKWMPDQGPTNQPGLEVACNALHDPRGWVPWPAPVVFDPTPLPERPYLLRMAKGSTGSVDVFGFGATKIYSLVPTIIGTPGGWTNRSRVTGGLYTTPANGSWRTCRFGDLLFATNYVDKIQQLNVSAGGSFIDVADTTAPKARYIATVRNQVMVADTVDSVDGAVPYRVRWSQWNKPTIWAYDRRYQSDFQDVYDLGFCTGLTGGQFGVVLMEEGLVRVTYIGPPDIWQFDTVAEQRGCLVPNSVIRVEGNTYFWAPDGWMMYDGSRTNHIGAGMVDQWFNDQLDLGNIHLMSAAAAPQRSRIYWLFCGSGNSGMPNRILALNQTTGGWSYGDVTGHVLGLFGKPAASVEDLDVYATLEDVPGSMDDPVYAGQDLRTMSMLTANGVETFNGNPLTAYFETGELAGQRVIINEAMFNGEAPRSAISLRIGKRDEPDLPIAWSPYYIPQRSGLIKPRREGSNLRLGLQLSQPWASAQSISANLVQRGTR